MPKPTPYIPPADRAVTETALCGAQRHEACPGRILSLTAAAHGQPCGCSCHRERPAA